MTLLPGRQRRTQAHSQASVLSHCLTHPWPGSQLFLEVITGRDYPEKDSRHFSPWVAYTALCNRNKDQILLETNHGGINVCYPKTQNLQTVFTGDIFNSMSFVCLMPWSWAKCHCGLDGHSLLKGTVNIESQTSILWFCQLAIHHKTSNPNLPKTHSYLLGHGLFSECQLFSRAQH